MSAVIKFFTRTQGHNKINFVDWISYGYLILGFFIIFLPVFWLLLNSVKSQFLLQKLDTNILPMDYERVARATVFGPEGKEIFILKDLPDWVLYWNDLTEDEKLQHDQTSFLKKYNGKEYYVLRTHFGLVSNYAKELILNKKLPDWLIRYPSMFPDAKKEYEPTIFFKDLNSEEVRLLSEFLGIKPYKPNGFTSQILVSAINADTNEVEEYSVNRLNTNKATINARLISNPQGGIVKIPSEQIMVNKTLRPSWINYTDPLTNNVRGMSFNAIKCLNNSVFVTIVATIITVLINSMAAFALSKYRFNGQIIFFIIILATLMVPASVLIVGIFKMVAVTGLAGTLWGVIIPGAATPTGVFMLRQYMLTIPDELLEAARMDAASEWSIYWRIVFPLALPAIAVLGILSIIWRWNDLILPMIAVSTTKAAYTIQLCLLDFQGEYVAQEHYRLAMTVVSLIPTTLVFVFLQRYITTGIATTGMK
ncbi:MAG: carbohydrate ABC transporter permease [Pelagibacteraceae bacterium]|jgi:alpha-1,4-digalacturonate transport system permease protein|nr:carbohydrate ABC transporter permease [Pelagibacteraceae bacterium]MBO6467369.1 carbohydrate ABC transporter permease [Pelagibacteraceae bacterium]MBO6470107.1 carbohydrate ABC transporter permease [Pelagibacteraceae bacterium]HJL58654.1 carbohydrate ABC transporter permease [Alphaproteobacteria bacterium]|tara:strand:+ start:2697 stop:4133 length:1437 start_codon:yes stop_codon:yes gene_type:complete